eukprot:TRINITY_DN4045_c0_g1_i1.p1 TRINITY_DN4045_c0_g1~~TRINITY_DN4045_c0_g1_i1.p1  ORF type:complete len:629 (+),score=183.69 TRINITY_DN4045_c0_g1_i1:151-2037(+)
MLPASACSSPGAVVQRSPVAFAHAGSIARRPAAAEVVAALPWSFGGSESSSSSSSSKPGFVRGQKGAAAAAAAAAVVGSGAAGYRRQYCRRALGGGAKGGCQARRGARGLSLVALAAVAEVDTLDPQVEARVADLKELRTRQLKEELEKLGLDTAGCVDKDSLLELLASDEGIAAVSGGASGAAAAEDTPPEAEASEPSSGSGRATGGPVIPAAVKRRLEELRSLRVRELRDALTKYGLYTGGCIDKESLVEVLETKGLQVLMRKYNAKKEEVRVARQSHTEAVSERILDIEDEYGKKWPIARKPKRTRARDIQRIPIHLMRGVDEEAEKDIAPDSCYIGVDLEMGRGGVKPCRFVLDLSAAHTVLKAAVAEDMGGQDRGMPSWLPKEVCQEHGFRSVDMGMSWFKKFECGQLDIVSMATTSLIPVPVGACGILGMDFIRKFEWDFRFDAAEAYVAKAPKDGWPVAFDVNEMRQVPLYVLKAPGGFPLQTAPVLLRPSFERCQDATSGPAVTGVQGIAVIDIGAAFTSCNRAALEALGLAGTEEVVATDELGKEFKQQVRLSFEFGNGVDGPMKAETTVAVGSDEGFASLGFSPDTPSSGPVLILGLDVLGAGRLVLSPRLETLWVPR